VTFDKPDALQTIAFKCAEAKRCNQLTVSNGRVQNLRFDRVEVKTGAPRP
jgi:hypothetical protein